MLNKRLNITNTTAHDIIIFTRVPKTGSLAINSLLEKLRDINNFTAYASIEGMPAHNENSEYTFEPNADFRKWLQKSVLDASPRPTMYCRHQNFLDFTEFFSEDEQPHPTYFSFVRNPVERQISWYYYRRNSLRLFQNESETMELLALNNDNPNPRELKESFEDCIAKQRRHCRWRPGSSIHSALEGPSHISQMSYFCGHHPDCDIFESQGLFQRAVENFEKRYAVTGVLEHFNTSIKVFESYLPKYFKGSKELFQTYPELLETNVNTFKPKVSNTIRQQLAKNMSKEIEFYHLVKQRLIKQYLSIK